ncbi:hypothetical protein D3C74_503870 [compost metagenome]
MTTRVKHLIQKHPNKEMIRHDEVISHVKALSYSDYFYFGAYLHANDGGAVLAYVNG